MSGMSNDSRTRNREIPFDGAFAFCLILSVTRSPSLVSHSSARSVCSLMLAAYAQKR